MADENENAHSDAPGADAKTGSRKGKLPLIIIIGAILLLQVVASFLIVTKVLAPGKEKEGPEEEKQDLVDFGPVYEMGDIVVNLSGSHGTRFLRASITFEAESPEVVEELSRKQPIFSDILINLLSSKSFSDLDSAEEKDLIRSEIITRCNEKLLTGSIKTLYFTDFIVQ
jgi:flagellar FliL protein